MKETSKTFPSKTIITIKFSIEDVKKAMIAYYLKGKRMPKIDLKTVSVDSIIKEDIDSWSGQVYDDGPLPEYFNGISMVIKKTNNE